MCWPISSDGTYFSTVTAGAGCGARLMKSPSLLRSSCKACPRMAVFTVKRAGAPGVVSSTCVAARVACRHSGLRVCG